MPIEIEAKFRAETPEPLAALAMATRLDHAILGPSRTVTELDRYLDTDDGLLAAAGWACRLRSRDGVTRISLKGPPTEPATGWRHRRPEVEGPASDVVDLSAWPTSAAHDLLASLADGHPLTERLRLVQERTERGVSLSDGSSVGTLTLDRASISSCGADLGELLVVELEVDPVGTDAEGELDRLAAALAAIPGLVPEPRSKLDHALERLADSHQLRGKGR